MLRELLYCRPRSRSLLAHIKAGAAAARHAQLADDARHASERRESASTPSRAAVSYRHDAARRLSGRCDAYMPPFASRDAPPELNSLPRRCPPAL